jgi:alkylation response protein AidB-like acyl-CoA dehydrogenase
VSFLHYETTYCVMAKRFATDVGFEVCNNAIQLHGGYGYLNELPIERYMRDARVRRILEEGATDAIR